MTSEPGLLVRARELRCERGGRAVCTPQSFSVRAGQALWLRGRNGSGKTSLLRVLAGLAAPAGGDLWRAPNTGILYAGHQNAVKDDLSLFENLQFLAQLGHLHAADAEIQAALRHWGLWTARHRPARVLSQGLRRRLSLARLSLAEQRALWVLDEPFDALDDEGMAVLAGQLYAHQVRGGATVLSSHLSWPAGAAEPDQHWLHPRGAQE
ncbi:MAG TPA: heme ABC exporter ATP-binding protein CcmA [Burkholderiaceae bacterium]|nr:heme ABC exporter ATP-binding protein CcmA [Burkholderiaceae bacterium]